MNANVTNAMQDQGPKQTGEHGQDGHVEIILDGTPVISPSRRRTGLQIRQLGPADRVDGFETQEVNEKGQKIRTIPDNEETELHKHERFRTVPNKGGPGAGTR